MIKFQTQLIKQQKFNTFIDFDVKNQKSNILRFDFHFFKRTFSIFFAISFFFVFENFSFFISISVSHSFHIKYSNINDFHENKNE